MSVKCRICSKETGKWNWYCDECKVASEKYSSILSRDKEIEKWGKINFINWFIEQSKKQGLNQSCYYCGITKEKSEQYYNYLVKIGYRKKRNDGTGSRRGKSLEIDRKDNGKPYSDENCVFACYYCNNAKSDVFEWVEFKHTIGPAIAKVIRSKLRNVPVE